MTAKITKESCQIFEMDSEDELLGPKTKEEEEEKPFTIKPPTTEDQQEAEVVNEEEKRGVGPNAQNIGKNKTEKEGWGR